MMHFEATIDTQSIRVWVSHGSGIQPAKTQYSYVLQYPARASSCLAVAIVNTPNHQALYTAVMDNITSEDHITAPTQQPGLKTLPRELLSAVCQLLPVSDLATLRQTNKHLKAFVDEDADHQANCILKNECARLSAELNRLSLTGLSICTALRRFAVLLGPVDLATPDRISTDIRQGRKANELAKWYLHCNATSTVKLEELKLFAYILYVHGQRHWLRYTDYEPSTLQLAIEQRMDLVILNELTSISAAEVDEALMGIWQRRLGADDAGCWADDAAGNGSEPLEALNLDVAVYWLRLPVLSAVSGAPRYCYRTERAGSIEANILEAQSLTDVSEMMLAALSEDIELQWSI